MALQGGFFEPAEGLRIIGLNPLTFVIDQADPELGGHVSLGAQGFKFLKRPRIDILRLEFPNQRLRFRNLRRRHPVGQSVPEFHGLHITPGCGEDEPHERLGIVLLNHPLHTLGIDGSQRGLGEPMTLLGGLAEPFDRLPVILRHAPSLVIERTQVELGFRIALLGKRLQLAHGRNGIIRFVVSDPLLVIGRSAARKAPKNGRRKDQKKKSGQMFHDSCLLDDHRPIQVQVSGLNRDGLKIAVKPLPGSRLQSAVS